MSVINRRRSYVGQRKCFVLCIEYGRHTALDQRFSLPPSRCSIRNHARAVALAAAAPPTILLAARAKFGDGVW